MGGLQEKPADAGPASLSPRFPGQLLSAIYTLHSWSFVSAESTHSPGAGHTEGSMQEESKSSGLLPAHKGFWRPLPGDPITVP